MGGVRIMNRFSGCKFSSSRYMVTAVAMVLMVASSATERKGYAAQETSDKTIITGFLYRNPTFKELPEKDRKALLKNKRAKVKVKQGPEPVRKGFFDKDKWVTRPPLSYISGLPVTIAQPGDLIIEQLGGGRRRYVCAYAEKMNTLLKSLAPLPSLEAYTHYDERAGGMRGVVTDPTMKYYYHAMGSNAVVTVEGHAKLVKPNDKHEWKGWSSPSEYMFEDVTLQRVTFLPDPSFLKSIRQIELRHHLHGALFLYTANAKKLTEVIDTLSALDLSDEAPADQKEMKAKLLSLDPTLEVTIKTPRDILEERLDRYRKRLEKEMRKKLR